MGVYYRAVSGEPLAFCQDYRERRSAAHKRFGDYSASKGGIGFVDWWGKLGGLIFDRGVEPPKGFIKHKRPASDGSTIWRPAGRGPEGKAVRAEFDALEPLPSGNEFAKQFGVPGTLEYSKEEGVRRFTTLNGVFPDTAFIAWVDDDFFVVLPDVEGEIARYASEGYTCQPSAWSPPAGLERSSRAHYELALAQQKVRLAEAA